MCHIYMLAVNFHFMVPISTETMLVNMLLLRRRRKKLRFEIIELLSVGTSINA